jgi:Fe-coproporphyrin III synthase
VNLIYGRSIRDLLREMPLYVTLLSKYASIQLFHAKIPLYGSVDVNNICNLHCTHCYWWLNRKEEEKDLSAEQWRQIIKSSFKIRHRIFFVTLVGGEPMLRPDIIEVFCKEMPKRVCVVTNGTFPLKRYDGLYFYWVSIDGTEKIHDSIRGKGTYSKTCRNVLDYIAGPSHEL